LSHNFQIIKQQTTAADSGSSRQRQLIAAAVESFKHDEGVTATLIKVPPFLYKFWFVPMHLTKFLLHSICAIRKIV